MSPNNSTNGVTNTSNGSFHSTNSESSFTITIGQKTSPDEWVEIIEPRTRTKIYANLESGLCAKTPPEGASVSRVEDFSDHWWELYDKKTGKFYYYNPEQQRTAWTKPDNSVALDGQNNERKKLLIIPVSKLQTFKRSSPDQLDIIKCDASTQTPISHTMSIGTQTLSDDVTEVTAGDNIGVNARINRRMRQNGNWSNNDKSVANANCYPEIQDGINAISFDGDDDNSNMHKTFRSSVSASSSERWKLTNNEESLDTNSDQSQQFQSQKSPLKCETSIPTSNFILDDLVDDEKNSSSRMTQLLDHRKLIENFRKSRHTSSFTANDSSLGKFRKVDPNHAVKLIKTVADSYLNHDKGQQYGSDKHLRQLSVLSTLPRPRKDVKNALSKQEEQGEIMDADYDVVEENCGYFSDSEHKDRKEFNSSLRTKKMIGDDASGDLSINEPHFDRNNSTRGSTFSVESFARENLSKHAMKGGGLFHRKVNWSRLISWTKNGIKHPMMSSVGPELNSESIASFKLIQQFMGDREVTMNKKYRQILAQSKSIDECSINNPYDKSVVKSTTVNKHDINLGVAAGSSSGSTFNVSDRVRDELAYELILKGCSQITLRDEIYIQLARQLTDNPSQESTRLGLILMSILLSYFSPSSKFSPFLVTFLETHPHQMARDICLPRLRRRLCQNWLTYCRKPTDGDEITIVRLSITKWPQYCGVFGESLEHIMSLQTCSPYLKTLRLPWILTTLGQKLLDTGGPQTEGIFRCAADHDLIAQLRLEIDCVDFRKITDAKQVHSLLSNVQDPHVIAGLLKLFFRQLTEPVFPSNIYDICLQSSHDGQTTCRIFNEHLHNLNKDVVAYLIRLLQTLSMSENVTLTKMDNSNLSMVWAPNLLRAPQNDDTLQSVNGSKWSISNWANDDQHNANTNQTNPAQSVIFEQTRREMQFIRSLILNLDTAFIENVI